VSAHQHDMCPGHVHHAYLHAPTSPALAVFCLQDARPPQGELAAAIQRDFKSLEALQTTMSAKSAAVQVRVCVCCAALRTCPALQKNFKMRKDSC